MAAPRKLYVDMDGVLADFDERSSEILGMSNYEFEFKFGSKEFWTRLDAVDDFFASFKPMPDMELLWEEVAPLRPTILTALPHTGADKVAAQKVAWIAQWLGPDVSVICTSNGKHPYAVPGAVLIDDRAMYRDKWVAAGGTFIHHLGAIPTLEALKTEGIL